MNFLKTNCKLSLAALCLGDSLVSMSVCNVPLASLYRFGLLSAKGKMNHFGCIAVLNIIIRCGSV